MYTGLHKGIPLKLLLSRLTMLLINNVICVLWLCLYHKNSCSVLLVMWLLLNKQHYYLKIFIKKHSITLNAHCSQLQ